MKRNFREDLADRLLLIADDSEFSVKSSLGLKNTQATRNVAAFLRQAAFRIKELEK